MQNKISNLLVLTMFVFCYGCGDSGYRAVEKRFNRDNASLDLSLSLEGRWKRICIIAPYTLNNMTEDIIGFNVDVEGQSNISSQDTHALLITLNGDEVVGMYAVPRMNIDFTPLGSKCFYRDKSEFKLIKNEYNQVWIGLHNKSLKERDALKRAP